MARTPGAKGPFLAGSRPPNPKEVKNLEERYPLPWQVSGLVLLVLICYWNSLDSSFQFDDFFMLGDAHITHPGFGWSVFRLEQTRPLTFWTFHWNYVAGGENPTGYHSVNVFLHAANAVLVLLLVRLHFAPLHAWLAATLFAVHPLQTEAVTYVFQRATLLATMFALLSFLAFLRERYGLSVLAFGLSLLAKEETMALPAFLLLYELLGRRGRPRRLGYYAAMLSLAALAIARLFYALHVLNEPSMGFRIEGISTLVYSLTEARVTWSYLQLFCLPLGLNIMHDVGLSRGLLSPATTLTALLGLLLVPALLAWMAWRRNAVALWGFGFFVLLAPSSSGVPAANVMFEHRTYFPLICLVVAAAWLLLRLPARFLTPVIAVLLLALSAATITRNRVWRDRVTLWEDAARKSPNMSQAHTQLGLAYFQGGEMSRAREALEKALRLDRENTQALWLLGITLVRLGEPKKALEFLGREMSMTGETAERLANIGAAYSELGDLDQAVRYFQRGLKLDPCSVIARLNLVRDLIRKAQKNVAFEFANVPAGCAWSPEQVQRLINLRRVAEQ